MRALAHLAWIPAGALVGFAASFVFGDVLTLPVDLYYLIYFAVVLGFLALYAVRTGLRLRPWLSRRAAWSVAAGVAVGLVMVQNVLSRPATERLAGGLLAWAVLWRGLVYGAVDGLLLSAFPWIVCWRALGAEENGLGRRLGATALAWGAILVVTTAYHLGYRDFRSGLIVQPNVGSTIMSAPTLVTATRSAPRSPTCSCTSPPSSTLRGRSCSCRRTVSGAVARTLFAAVVICSGTNSALNDLAPYRVGRSRTSPSPWPLRRRRPK